MARYMHMHVSPESPLLPKLRYNARYLEDTPTGAVRLWCPYCLPALTEHLHKHSMYSSMIIIAVLFVFLIYMPNHINHAPGQ